jgi:hypothetical protein
MPTTPDLVIKVGDEEYRFDPKKILNVEAIAIEKAAGLTWAQVMVGLNTGQLSAVTGVVWVLRKRENPRLQFGEVVFNVGDAEVIDPDIDPRYQASEEAPVELPKEEPSQPELS